VGAWELNLRQDSGAACFGLLTQVLHWVMVPLAQILDVHNSRKLGLRSESLADKIRVIR
jgi:hypothetical protein